MVTYTAPGVMGWQTSADIGPAMRQRLALDKPECCVIRANVVVEIPFA